MSQFQKILDVLDLYTETRPSLTAEDVSELLGVSRPTAFRYLKQLADAGMVVRLSGRYALGARIIELDYRSRRFDPILLASRDVVRSLTLQTRSSAMVSALFGDQIVNIHQDSEVASAAASFGRGRILPLFRGAAAKVILAHMSTPRLKRLYAAHADDPQALTLGPTWEAFQQYFRQIRKQGFYVSREELDEEVMGVSAPLISDDNVVGAITALYDLPHHALLDGAAIGRIVAQHAAAVSRALSSASTSAPNRPSSSPG